MGRVESGRPVVLIVEDEFLLRMDAIDMIAAAGLPTGGRFLPKPYSPVQVTRVLRELTGRA